MFTERENRVINAIISGKTDRIRIYLTFVCIIAVFAVIVFVLGIENEIFSFAQKEYEKAQLFLSKVHTSTKIEGVLKSASIAQQVYFIKFLNILLTKFFDLFITGYIFWTFFIIASVWGRRSMEKIIKKLVEKSVDSRS